MELKFHFCFFLSIICCYRRRVHTGESAVEATAALCHMVDGHADVHRQCTGAVGSFHASRRKSCRQHGHPQFGRCRYAHGILSVHYWCARLSIPWELQCHIVCVDWFVELHWRWHTGHGIVGSIVAHTGIHFGGTVSVDCRSIRWPSSSDHAQCFVVFVHDLVGGHCDCHLARWVTVDVNGW